MKRRELTPWGRQIKKALVDCDMTQRQLAVKIGVSPQYLSHILCGTRTGDKYKQQIASTLGFQLDQTKDISA